MERVKKENIVLYNEKSNNVATIKGAFGILGNLFAYLLLLFSVILFMFINEAIKDCVYKGSSNLWGIIIFFGVLLLAIIVATIVRLIMVKIPNIYFVGNEMYIKENKNFYLRVLPEELDGYVWNTYATRNHYMNGKNGYASCNYWGIVNLTINGETYKLSCSSLKKTKHYLDGFKNGLSVNENPFDGDKLQKLTRSIYAYYITPLLVAFASIMSFAGVNNVISIIGIIVLSLSCLAILIGLILIFVKLKMIRQIQRESYDMFVTKQYVNFKESDNN